MKHGLDICHDCYRVQAEASEYSCQFVSQVWALPYLAVQGRPSMFRCTIEDYSYLLLVRIDDRTVRQIPDPAVVSCDLLSCDWDNLPLLQEVGHSVGILVMQVLVSR